MTIKEHDLTLVGPGLSAEDVITDLAPLGAYSNDVYQGTAAANVGVRTVSTGANPVLWDNVFVPATPDVEVYTRANSDFNSNFTQGVAGRIQGDGSCYLIAWEGVTNGYCIHHSGGGEFAVETTLANEVGSPSPRPTPLDLIKLSIVTEGADVRLTAMLNGTQILSVLDTSVNKIIANGGFGLVRFGASNETTYHTLVGAEDNVVTPPTPTIGDDPLSYTLSGRVDDLNWRAGTPTGITPDVWKDDILEVRKVGNPADKCLFKVISNTAAGVVVVENAKGVAFAVADGDTIIHHPSSSGVNVEKLFGEAWVGTGGAGDNKRPPGIPVSN